MKRQDFAIAVKAFIVDNDRVLLVRRSYSDTHKPGIWEIPGGRIAPAENPFDALKREVKEEVGFDIAVLNPLKVHHFTRDDEQKITMITFLCKPITANITISNEHSDAKWININEAHQVLHKSFHEEISIFQKYFSDVENF